MKRKTVKQLEAQVAELEQFMVALKEFTLAGHDFQTRLFGLVQKNEATMIALSSIVGELAEHEGISADQFSEHLRRRVDFWHDYLLCQVEDLSSALAAAIDSRDVVPPDVDTPYPPLFD